MVTHTESSPAYGYWCNHSVSCVDRSCVGCRAAEFPAPFQLTEVCSRQQLQSLDVNDSA